MKRSIVKIFLILSVCTVTAFSQTAKRLPANQNPLNDLVDITFEGTNYPIIKSQYTNSIPEGTEFLTKEISKLILEKIETDNSFSDDEKTKMRANLDKLHGKLSALIKESLTDSLKVEVIYKDVLRQIFEKTFSSREQRKILVFLKSKAGIELIRVKKAEFAAFLAKKEYRFDGSDENFQQIMRFYNTPEGKKFMDIDSDLRKPVLERLDEWANRNPADYFVILFSILQEVIPKKDQ